MRIPVRLVVDVDVDAYRREYGEPDASLDDIREYVRDFSRDSTRAFAAPFDYVRSVDLKEGR